MISNPPPLLQVPAHHHHCLALRPHRLLQLQGPPVLQADQVSKSFRPFVKPLVTQSGSGSAGSRSQSMCFATLSLFSTLVLLMVPPSLHRAINKKQPGRAKAFHHTRNPCQSVLCSASNGIGSIGTERAPDFAQKLMNTVRDWDGSGKNIGAISRSS